MSFGVGVVVFGMTWLGVFALFASLANQAGFFDKGGFAGAAFLLGAAAGLAVTTILLAIGSVRFDPYGPPVKGSRYRPAVRSGSSSEGPAP
jgi:hypothetical protein